MFATTSTSGFHNAPVSKGLLVFSGSASLLNIILVSSTTKKILSSYKWLQVLQHTKFWQVLSSTFYFSNARDLLCGSFLLYTFRVFERRLGSGKYSSHALASTIITASLQLIAVYGLKCFGHEVEPLPPGLYGVIFANLVQYFFKIPSIDAVTVVGVPISGKVLSYSIAIQMLLGSKESLLAGACGMVAGILYKSNVAYVQSWLKFPEFVLHLSSRMFGSLLASDEDITHPVAMGATLDIQEQQQVEWYEQQMWRRALAANTTHPRTRARAGQGYAEVMVPPADRLQNWLLGSPNNLHHQPPHRQPVNNHQGDNATAPQQPAVEVSEQQVQTLVEMGFSRQDVLNALSITNNNVNNATSVLLSSAT